MGQAVGWLGKPALFYWGGYLGRLVGYPLGGNMGGLVRSDTWGQMLGQDTLLGVQVPRGGFEYWCLGTLGWRCGYKGVI